MPRSTHDLLNRYLQAVGFWLPRKQKEDILAELLEDLHSQIDDREEQLGHPLDESEVAAILKQRGRPEFVAGKFLPQQALIGPLLYPIYLFVLKIVALCYLVPWIIGLSILLFNHAQGALHIPLPLPSAGSLWGVVATQFCLVTLIFAVIERFWNWKGTHLPGDWDPRTLPRVRVQQPSRRRGNALAGIACGILGLVWLTALPRYPFLILGPGAYTLHPTAVWHSVYVPILVLAVAGIVENVVTLIRPQLAWFRPLFRFATTLLSLGIAYRLLQTRTYLTATDAHVAQYAAITNTVVLICVASMAVGAAIALVVYAWQAVWELSRSMRPAPPRLA